MDLSRAIDEMGSAKEKIWVRGTYCGSIAILGPEYQVSPTKTSQVQVGRRDKPVSIPSRRLSSVSPVSNGTSFANMATAPKGIFETIYESLFREAKIPTSQRENETSVSGEQLLPLGSDHWSMPGDLIEKTLGLRTAITVQGETVLVPPSTDYDDMICLLPGCDIALIFREFNQWTVEGLGVHSMPKIQPTHGKAVHVCLDIHILEKIAAAAEFESGLETKASWWGQS